MTSMAVVDNGIVVNIIEASPDFTIENRHVVPLPNGAGIGWLWDGESFTAPEISVTVPESVTMRQARLAMHMAGILPQVQDAIDSLDEPFKTEAQIEWEYGSLVARDHALISLISTEMSLSPQQVDDLFIQASSL